MVRDHSGTDSKGLSRMNTSEQLQKAIVMVFLVAVIVTSPISLPAQEHHEGHGGGEHASGESGSVERWLPRLEDPDRDGWQRPEYVVELLDMEPGAAVADLGTGTGYFVPYLAAAVGPGGTVYALDVDAELVDYVAERAKNEGLANVDARVIPYDDPGLEPGSVDRVLIVNTWHHIEDREAYAAKLATALTPTGAVYVVDITMDSPQGPPKWHRLAQDVVEAELAAGGLEVVVLDEELEGQYVVVGRLRSEDS
jgi:SAM-dependent methyltransferase